MYLLKYLETFTYILFIFQAWLFEAKQVVLKIDRDKQFILQSLEVASDAFHLRLFVQNSIRDV